LSRLEEEIVFVVIVMSMPFEIAEVVGPFLTEEAAANYTTSLTNCGRNWAVCQLSDPYGHSWCKKSAPLQVF
jgi:hypothetical protein